MAPVKLTDKDVDNIVRLVATEADHKLIWSHPEEYTAQVHGIVDTVLNRVASGKWGGTVESVANADRQFSDINGPGSKGYGTVDKVPASRIPAFLPNIVKSWVTARSNGTPSSVGGNLHYANPQFSDQSNMDWINALDGPKLGYGASTHIHGTTAGFSPVEAQVEYGPRTGTAKLQDIQDRNAARQGYGEIAPNPGPGRPAYFNETGAPPIPASRTPAAPQPSTMSPALQAARQRLTAARDMKAAAASNGATDPAAMAVTPRLTSANGEVTGIEDTRPQLDWGQFKPGASVDGVGSLLDGGINPAAPNPAKPPVAGLRLPTTPATVTGRPDAPIGSLPAARTGTTVTGRPDAPIGSLPVASTSAVALHPFDPARNQPRDNGDGSVSTEISRTVQLSDGTWANVPSLWWGDGNTVRDFGSMEDDQLARFAERYEQQSGSRFPRYATIPAAEMAAVARSEAGGGTAGGMTSRPEKPTPIKAPVSSASGPAAGRPGGATSVPASGGKINNPAATSSTSQPSAVVRKQETGKLSNGKTVTIGQSYIVGDRLMIAEPGKNGTAVLKDVKDTLPFGASMLFENTMGGAAARAIAMPAIKQQLAQAGTAAMDGVNQLASGAVKTVGSLASQARDGVSSLFTLRPAATPSSTSAGNTLSAPGAGLTPAQKAAMISVPLSAAVKPLAPSAPKPTNTLIKTTVANPAYAEWEKKYGDGSQIQTAATGGLITANQLAAIQNVNGAVQAPIKKPTIPPPPPKTITVMKPGNNTLAAPSAPATPPPPKVQTTQTVSGKTVNVGQTYQSGGYLYTANPNGTFTKVGKVGGSPSTSVLSSLSTSSPSSAQAYAAANAGPGSVAAMERQHSGGSTYSGGPASGGEYASGGR